MKLTALGSGYYRVFKDGVEVSKHTSEREAVEAATNLEIADPSKAITYKHDYEVKVESEVATPIPVPTPIPPAPVNPIILYSPTSIWNTKLADNAPVHPNSVGFVSEISAINRISGPWVNIGTPFYIVKNSDLKVPIFLTDANNAASPIGQEIAQGINIPANLVGSQVDSDKSCAIYNVDIDKEYNIWQLTFNTTKNRYEGVSAGILPNASKSDGTFTRYAYWNSVRAGHTPLGAGMDMKKELDNGVLPHVGALALGRAKNTFVYPCKSSDGWESGINSIPEGTRIRFPYDISINTGWCPYVKMKVTQGRDYGFIPVDKTGNSNVFYIEGMAQYGVTNGYDYLKTKFCDNKDLWDVLGSKNFDTQFPWTKLEVVA